MSNLKYNSKMPCQLADSFCFIHLVGFCIGTVIHLHGAVKLTAMHLPWILWIGHIFPAFPELSQYNLSWFISFAETQCKTSVTKI